MSDKLYSGEPFDTFGIIYDYRQEAKVRHKLIDVLFIIVSALFARVDEVEEIHMWASQSQNVKWLKRYIALENGIPSKSTIWRVLNGVDPKQFKKCFISWVKGLTVFSDGGDDIVAIDGKTMRGSKDSDSVTHMVSVWCSVNNLVLDQAKTDDKSNEITAIPKLLDPLYVEDCVVLLMLWGARLKL